MDQQALLDALVERLRKALGDRLLCLVLHGSAAAGDFHEKVSDLNTLAVLTRVTKGELDDVQDACDWWLNKKQPLPTFLSREELANAHDAFAIEFIDILHAHRTLYGEDLVAELAIDPAHHRHQVEHELRSRLLRLRGRYTALQGDRRALISLLCDSLPTFATMIRHELLLAGKPAPHKKREIFQAAERELGLSAAPFAAILEVRENQKKLRDPELHELFEAYLTEITRAAERVDRLGMD